VIYTFYKRKATEKLKTRRHISRDRAHCRMLTTVFCSSADWQSGDLAVASVRVSIVISIFTQMKKGILTYPYLLFQNSNWRFT